MRLGILTSHPIQYQAPWFRGLAKEVELEVFFCHRQSAAEQGGAGFGVAFEWDVDLLSGYRHRFLKNVAAKPGVNRASGCDTPEIFEVLANGKFDAFIVSGWHLKSYWQGVRAARRAGVPVLVRGDSQLGTPRAWWKRWAKELVYRLLLRQFNGFLVVGQRNREYLAHYGVTQEKMFFAPHFVDNEWFAGKAEMARKQKAEIRKGWGADDETLVVLFVGKFIGKKRPGDLLQALAELCVASGTLTADTMVGRVTPCAPSGEFDKASGAHGVTRPTRMNVMAVFVGAGELEKDLRAAAPTLGVRAHFAGFKNQTELPAYYACADVLVLPSDGGETWGLVVNEAMACGTPAIVSDAVGCAPDLIAEGKTGSVFPVGNVEALAVCLRKLAQARTPPEQQKKFFAEKMTTYSVQTAVAGTVAAVRTLAEGSRK